MRLEPQIDHVAERLCEVLAAEERLYVEFRALLQRERECMVALQSERLEELVREKATLAEEGRLLEETRVAVSQELARLLGLDPAGVTLSRICDHLRGGAPALRAAHTRLVALLGAVRELLDANRVFAGDATLQVRGALRVLGRMLPVDATLPTRPGGVGRSPRPRTGRLVRESA